MVSAERERSLNHILRRALGLRVLFPQTLEPSMTKNQSAEKEEFWRMAIVQQQASGMSIKAFCLQQDLSAHAFSWWKRELKKRDGRSCPRRRKKQNDKRINDTRLIPVNVMKESSASHAENELNGAEHAFVEVVSPTGYALRIRSESPPSCLTEVLNAITACKAIGGTSC